jgi:hypothetical protein
MSYNGQLNFGLIADYDALPDVETLADELRSSTDELAAAAAIEAQPEPEGTTSSAPGTDRNRLGRRTVRAVE